jgi:hypothetical protein
LGDARRGHAFPLSRDQSHDRGAITKYHNKNFKSSN